jgi:glycine betaine/proline transport system substrate-binding protein
MEPGSVLDGSITRAWNQRLENEDGEQVPNPVESETCSANPCHLGWLTNDIAITASKAFLERYPAAATLLASIEIPVTDVNKAIARIRFDDLPSGTPDKTSQVAREWIESNRKLVEGWLETAVAAA